MVFRKNELGLLYVSRPAISFYQGVCTLHDEEAGYSRELSVEELEALLADAYEHVASCLRVAFVRPPARPQKREDDDGW